MIYLAKKKKREATYDFLHAIVRRDVILGGVKKFCLGWTII